MLLGTNSNYDDNSNRLPTAGQRLGRTRVTRTAHEHNVKYKDHEGGSHDTVTGTLGLGWQEGKDGGEG